MKILTQWLRSYLPSLPVDDRQLAEALTLRGIAVEGVHALADGRGHVFEMDITTNRVDAMNHYGVAREAATIWDLELLPLERGLPAGIAGGSTFPVRIEPEAEAFCGRFTARVLRGVRIGPSEGQVAGWFGDLGSKLISNAVDASNAVLLGMGHPTHAFDLDKIQGGIVVRLARAGEKIRLLDGTERTLEADDLVIADEQKALSLAGVMGGWQSMITPETKNILVESAWFDPAAIRRSSRRHGLHTDASHRFERGADFAAAPVANDLVSRLILASGGAIEGEMVDMAVASAEERTVGRPAVVLELDEVRRHLGATIEDAAGESALTAELVERYLRSLGCGMVPWMDAPKQRAAVLAHRNHVPSASFEVTLPSWRLDLERPIDLIEEVARVFGYNRFANTLPAPRPVVAHAGAAAERAVRQRLLAMGYTEAVSSTFASEAEAAMFAPATGDAGHVRLENPLSAEAQNLRPSLLPGMVSMLALNLNRDVSEARLFEQGQVFGAPGSGPDHIPAVEERSSLALGLTSATPRGTTLHGAAEAPVFELKGAIEELVGMFAPAGGPAALSFTSEGVPGWIEAGRGGVAKLHNRVLGYFGELASAEAARHKLRQPVYVATVDLDLLYAEPIKRVTAREISRFQAVVRDLSFVFPDGVVWRAVSEAIHALSLPELRTLEPLEIFRDAKGKAVPAGHYSLLFRAVYQAEDRTLREEELVAAQARIVETLTAMGGVQRAPDL